MRSPLVAFLQPWTATVLLLFRWGEPWSLEEPCRPPSQVTSPTVARRLPLFPPVASPLCRPPPPPCLFQLLFLHLLPPPSQAHLFLLLLLFFLLLLRCFSSSLLLIHHLLSPPPPLPLFVSSEPQADVWTSGVCRVWPGAPGEVLQLLRDCDLCRCQTEQTSPINRRLDC